MLVDRREIFQTVKAIRGGQKFTLAEVQLLDAAIDRALANVTPQFEQATPSPTPPNPITARIALELISHEAIVQEAYKDSVGVWTWAVGVTNASGHQVHPRYVDNPQDLRKCIEVTLWLMREKYLPTVLKAFTPPLTEAQLGAALSFHYNTGAIRKATWVKLFNEGDVAGAKLAIMNYRKPAEIISRREKERDLFFDGKWSNDGKAMVYPVRKPSYSPDWKGARRVDVSAIVRELLQNR